MDEPKMKFLKILPVGQSGTMTIPFDKHELWEWIYESSPGGEWEIQVIEMTEKEYEELPEHEGW